MTSLTQTIYPRPHLPHPISHRSPLPAYPQYYERRSRSHLQMHYLNVAPPDLSREVFRLVYHQAQQMAHLQCFGGYGEFGRCPELVHKMPSATRKCCACCILAPGGTRSCCEISFRMKRRKVSATGTGHVMTEFPSHTVSSHLKSNK